MIANLMAEVKNVVFWRNWLKAGFILWYFSLRFYSGVYFTALFLVLVIDYFMVFIGNILWEFIELFAAVYGMIFFS